MMKLDINQFKLLKKATYGTCGNRIDVTDIVKNFREWNSYDLGNDLFHFYADGAKKFTILTFEDYSIKFYPENTKLVILSIVKTVYLIENPNIKLGSRKYFYDLINRYVTCNFIIVSDISMFRNLELKSDDIIMISHFYATQIRPFDVVNKNLNGCKVYICLHDDHIIIDFLTNSENSQDYQKVFDISTTIYQTEFVFRKYKKYFNIEHSVFIPHNDFKINKSSIVVPPIINNTINITTMCSLEKGYEMVSLLRRKFITYKGYRINITRVGIETPYYSEKCYDEYIKHHNFHGFLYLTHVGETWGYSFTMAINSGLPILFNNIGSFKERIPNKPQYFATLKKKTMTYIQFSKMLDYIIENQGKYNNSGCNTDIIYQPGYNKIFDEYLNVVLIPSKIYFSNNPFSYTTNRSIYSPAERLSQLFDTISSIRQHIPQSYIVLIDNSNFCQNEHDLLDQKVDHFINTINDNVLTFFTDLCEHKSLGEISLLLKAKDHIKNLKIKNLFKISGRYVLNDNFNFSNFISNHNIFKKNYNIIDREYYYTCLYKIKPDYIDDYFNVLTKYIDSFLQNNSLIHMDIEVALPILIDYNFKTIDDLGITQNIAVWKDNSSI